MHVLWQDPNYRIFLFFQALFTVAVSIAPLMVAAAREQLGASAQAQGAFGMVYLFTVASLGWAIGLLADRFGYRLIGCVCSALLLVAFLLVLAMRQMSFWYAAYGAFSLATFTSATLLCNMSAELCPGISLDRLLAVGNALLTVFVLCATTVCGGIADLVGSYQPVFVANLVISLVSLMGFALIVREPRSGRLYIIKTTPRA